MIAPTIAQALAILTEFRDWLVPASVQAAFVDAAKAEADAPGRLKVARGLLMVTRWTGEAGADATIAILESALRETQRGSYDIGPGSQVGMAYALSLAILGQEPASTPPEEP